jgi:AraC-like DNA-binding protein
MPWQAAALVALLSSEFWQPVDPSLLHPNSVVWESWKTPTGRGKKHCSHGSGQITCLASFDAPCTPRMARSSEMLLPADGLNNAGAASWPAALVVWGPGSSSTCHAHHSVQLILALTGKLRVRTGVGAAWRSCRALLVRPDALHQVNADGAEVLIAFVEKESLLGASLLARVPRDITLISNREVSKWRKRLASPRTLDSTRVERWLRSELGGEPRQLNLHPRVQRVLRLLRACAFDSRDLSLAYLSSVAGLSPSRFRHAFTESVGISLRSYLLWLRLQRATSALAAGHTSTQAAHMAGFSDASHLSRTIRRMLGATPRELVGRIPSTRQCRIHG